MHSVTFSFKFTLTASLHEKVTLQYEYDLLHELSLEIDDCLPQQCFIDEHPVVARLQKRLLKLVKILCVCVSSDNEISEKKNFRFLWWQEDDFKLKLKVQSTPSIRKANDPRVEEKPIGRPMDDKLPMKSVSQDCRERNAIHVKELTTQIQRLRQSVQEKELVIRKNEISSNFKVLTWRDYHTLLLFFSISSIWIEFGADWECEQ